jgi:hypothetical protein
MVYNINVEFQIKQNGQDKKSESESPASTTRQRQ